MNKVDRPIIAAALTLDIDYARLEAELSLLIENLKCIQFDSPSDSGIGTAYSLLLRNSSTTDSQNLWTAKETDTNSWSWDDTLNIPYTRSVIDNLPMVTLGMVVVHLSPGYKSHTDWNDPDDLEHTLGLSLIPDTAGTTCDVWSELEQQFVKIPGNAMLLNDSIQHFVSDGTGTRITIQIFGKFDYAWFDDKIDRTNCYYR